MPDSLFFGEGNLRAACAGHNTARAIAEKFEREVSAAAPTGVISRDYTRHEDDDGDAG